MSGEDEQRKAATFELIKASLHKKAARERQERNVNRKRNLAEMERELHQAKPKK